MYAGVSNKEQDCVKKSIKQLFAIREGNGSQVQMISVHSRPEGAISIPVYSYNVGERAVAHPCF